MKAKSNIVLIILALLFMAVALFSFASCTAEKKTVIRKFTVVAVRANDFDAVCGKLNVTFAKVDSVWIGRVINVSIGR